MLLADVAKSVDVLGEVGRPENNVDKNKNININDGGTSNSYRIAKLKRDYPIVAQGIIDTILTTA